jgi:hypothetical protein
LSALGWEKFFIKDFVKSLKTSVGSIIAKPEDINVVLAEMQKFRSTIEGGVCARRINSPFFSVDVADRVDGYLELWRSGTAKYPTWLGGCSLCATLGGMT